MRYKEIDDVTKNAIAKIVLHNNKIAVQQILKDVFHCEILHNYTKFFLIGTNEITKSERIIGVFYVLNLSNDENFVLFQSTVHKTKHLSGFVECIARNEQTVKLETMIIHPFQNDNNYFVKIVQSEIKTLPMTILLCTTNSQKKVVDFVTKEHWELLEKRFRGFINVLL